MVFELVDITSQDNWKLVILVITEYIIVHLLRAPSFTCTVLNKVMTRKRYFERTNKFIHLFSSIIHEDLRCHCGFLLFIQLLLFCNFSRRYF